MRFEKYSSVVSIFENHKDNAFSIRHVSLDEITKEIKRLDVKKARQDTDIASKVINSDIFADFFFLNLINIIASSVFPSNFKNAEITPVHKKDLKKTQNPTTDQVTFFRIYQKFMKSVSFSKSQITSKRHCQISIWFSKGYSTQNIVGHGMWTM